METKSIDKKVVRGISTRLNELFSNRFSGTIQLFLDVAGWVGAVIAAAYLRLEFSFRGLSGTRVAALAIFVAAVQAFSGLAVGLYRQRWRFGSLDEIGALVRSAVITTAAMAVLNYLTDPHLVPMSAVAVGGFVGLIFMFAVRYTWRIIYEMGRQPNESTAKRMIVFGAGEAGMEMVQSLKRNPASPFLPVAMLDDDPSKKRLEVSKVRVEGDRNDLETVANHHGAQTLLIAMPNASKELVSDLHRRSRKLGLDVKILPPVQELFGPLDSKDIRDLTEADLLGRRQIETDVESVVHYLKGKRVLVTGAGGSIGSEMCRQLARLKPEALLMLDRDESALHSVQMSIDGRALLDSPNLLLADIRDSSYLHELFEKHRPDVVFHAAALKHLPLLESHPSEGVKTNVWGSLNVLEAAQSVGVSHFVNISTDKAANPSSVLGYSKRVAERLTSGVAATTDSGTYLSVRFGNVLGSRGSMLPAFRAMIEAGGPLTVTDKDVTRFFMTIPEAVQLVIQAGAIGRDGEVLVLDMGEPVKIDDVARMLIEASGKPIEIVYTGLREGEKMHEELFGDDEVDERPFHPLISHTLVPGMEPEQALALPVTGDSQKIVRSLAELCDESA